MGEWARLEAKYGERTANLGPMSRGMWLHFWRALEATEVTYHSHFSGVPMDNPVASPGDPRTQFDLEHIFKYHAPSGEQLAQYARLREAARCFAIAIVQDTPVGADQSAAIRHVRDAVMTANAAVALGGRLNNE